MPKTYTDYINKIAISIPDEFIDVKTGENIKVSSKIEEQIEYHAENSTLIHLIYSALNEYFSTKPDKQHDITILQELQSIKIMLEHGYIPGTPFKKSLPTNTKTKVNIDDVNEILEAFGG